MKSPSGCHLRPIVIRIKRGGDHTGGRRGLRESGGDEGENGEEDEAEMGHGGGEAVSMKERERKEKRGFRWEGGRG
ncbi:hypothetical protein F2Q69_00010256 [Brassica cretica]|uniref:Uncharacterized protein n=1 Tax=Brassica cretica TaxID=69181 RepID=A0A8S9QQD7_BRACR|nr:hypothetical protein F2Q69_00010256 [Brassica cretica]